jgi:hypothetical protein
MAQALFTNMSCNSEPFSAVDAQSFAPGRAYWNQRIALARCRQRIMDLSQAVNRQSDLSVHQFAQLFASVLEFAPDLIIELGRGQGNSLCAFTEASHQLSTAVPCRVLSLCSTSEWHDLTVPNLRKIVSEEWFAPVEAIQCNILEFDFARALTPAKRVLIFWDAHGFDIAECVLGRILPEVAGRQHLVFMHDMSDIRYTTPGLNEYGGRGLWKGVNAAGASVRLGFIDSAVAQAISIVDFAGRNGITLDSADHSHDLEINQVPGRVEEMRELLGDQIFSLQGDWFWFTLNQHPGPYTFPSLPLRAPHSGDRSAQSRAADGQQSVGPAPGWAVSILRKAEKILLRAARR